MIEDFSPGELERLRAETPGCAERVHLNNAGAGLMPRVVLQSIQEHLELEARIGGYEAEAERLPAIEACYGDVARLIAAEAHQIAFVENSTVAYSQALSAVDFREGDLILTSQNDYISNQIMFLSLAKRHGVRLVRAPEHGAGGFDPERTLALIEELRPRLVAMTQIPTNSGLVQPVETLGQACQEFGALYFIDACQSLGQMPLDAPALGCDFLSATSRKFLRGPRGAGLLYVSDRALAAGMEPLFLDMRGARWTAPDRYAPRADARRFENWEFSHGLVLGTAAAARLATSLGLERIQARSWALAQSAREALEALPGVRVLDRGERRCAIVSFHAAGIAGEALHAGLSERGINTTLSKREYAQLDFADKGCEWALRLSPHYYNTADEVSAAVRAVDEILARSGGQGS